MELPGVQEPFRRIAHVTAEIRVSYEIGVAGIVAKVPHGLINRAGRSFFLIGHARGTRYGFGCRGITSLYGMVDGWSGLMGRDASSLRKTLGRYNPSGNSVEIG